MLQSISGFFIKKIRSSPIESYLHIRMEMGLFFTLLQPEHNKLQPEHNLHLSSQVGNLDLTFTPSAQRYLTI